MFLNKSNSNQSLQKTHEPPPLKILFLIPQLVKNRQLSWNTASCRNTMQRRADHQILPRRYRIWEHTPTRISWSILKMPKEWSLMCFSERIIKVLFLKIIEHRMWFLSSNQLNSIPINILEVVVDKRRTIKFFLTQG